MFGCSIARCAISRVQFEWDARTSRPHAHSNARGRASPFWNLGSMQRAHELAAGSDEKGGGVWRRIIEAVAQVANNAPPGPVH
jgi:hypothetical protein